MAPSVHFSANHLRWPNAPLRQPPGTAGGSGHRRAEVHRWRVTAERHRWRVRSPPSGSSPLEGHRRAAPLEGQVTAERKFTAQLRSSPLEVHRPTSKFTTGGSPPSGTTRSSPSNFTAGSSKRSAPPASGHRWRVRSPPSGSSPLEGHRRAAPLEGQVTAERKFTAQLRSSPLEVHRPTSKFTAGGSPLEVHRPTSKFTTGGSPPSGTTRSSPSNFTAGSSKRSAPPASGHRWRVRSPPSGSSPLEGHRRAAPLEGQVTAERKFTAGGSPPSGTAGGSGHRRAEVHRPTSKFTAGSSPPNFEVHRWRFTAGSSPPNFEVHRWRVTAERPRWRVTTRSSPSNFTAGSSPPNFEVHRWRVTTERHRWKVTARSSPPSTSASLQTGIR
ncbi:uncharacterized protein DKFZp434B061-like [Rosa chinensis]|uniref:uncharacterized protein DKFZp434B061-like n=1 Tax=Rosa chinensis TaxID=74649 RepID=UPI000D08CBB5|nr:uncharacterized protein DKFZp434B061-like [Rosa chinensis]